MENEELNRRRARRQELQAQRRKQQKALMLKLIIAAAVLVVSVAAVVIVSLSRPQPKPQPTEPAPTQTQPQITEDTQPPQTQPPETEPATEEQPDDGDRAPMAGVLLTGVIFAALLILTAAALILRRRHVLKKKQAILMQADVREAVIWSFADSIRILERMGIRRGKGSLTALTAPIRDRFGGEIADRFDAASRINAKALFSGKKMTEPERETVHGFRHCVLLCLQNHSSRLSIIWMKYVLCMF
jgi:hypothetical protein